MGPIRPRVTVVEIVGPAGSGKTTLTGVLAQADPALQVGLRLRSWRWAPLYFAAALVSLPAMLGGVAAGRRFTGRQVTLMVYLQVQLWVVQRFTAPDKPILVLDQGPVYKLAELCDFDLESRKRAGFGQWWDRMIEHWARLLGVIIQLDAADEVLMARIAKRGKDHVVKDAPAAEMRAYLARYRAAIHGISAQAAANGPGLLQFRTDQKGLDSMVQQILTQLAGGSI